MLKGKQIIVLGMEEDEDAATKLVVRLLGANQACVFGMVGVKGVKKKVA